MGLILTVLGIGGGTVCAMVLGETHFSKVTWTAVGVVVIATSLDFIGKLFCLSAPRDSKTKDFDICSPCSAIPQYPGLDLQEDH